MGAARAALERGDFERLATLGHNLQGSGASFGFPAMSGLGKRIERAAEGKDAAGVAELLIELESTLSEATDVGTADERAHGSRKR
jgi:HPt (histidine-containing phosphotransfer) domain-containing protein